jgi:hypothetical protein
MKWWVGFGIVSVALWVFTHGEFLLSLLAAALLVGAVKGIYSIGYQEGRKDVLDPPDLRPLTEDQRTHLLMNLTLPRWRRVAGYAALGVPGVLFWVLLFFTVRSSASGWFFFLAAVLSIASMIAGVVLMEWLWKSFREAQARSRQDLKNSDTVDPLRPKGK